MTAHLVLASSSAYRRELLARLRIGFEIDAANIDETPLPGESASDLAVRLAREKAAHVASRHQDAWVIGADQVAVRDREIVGKPGSAANSVEQLRLASGQTLSFLTAVCVMSGRGERRDEHLDETRVKFRTLSASEIARYVELERPYDCAGSFKSEGLGISLFESIESRDPTALIGLPLIWLAGALRRAGLNVP